MNKKGAEVLFNVTASDNNNYFFAKKVFCNVTTKIVMKFYKPTVYGKIEHTLGFYNYFHIML